MTSERKVTQRRRWWHLALMTATYIVGELSHFLVGIVSRKMAQDIHYGDIGCVEKEDVKEAVVDCYTLKDNSSCVTDSNGTCTWQYTGLGLQYQILAGPAFIAVFTVAGIVFGTLADKFNRQVQLIGCLLLLSVSTLMMGFSTQYWHLVICRMCIAAGEAGFSPLAAGMISDHFPPKLRGLAMAIFTWGVYFGYGISYAVGNYVTAADINGQGWRWAYYVASLPGFVVSILHLSSSDPRSGWSPTNTELSELKTDDQRASERVDSAPMLSRAEVDNSVDTVGQEREPDRRRWRERAREHARALLRPSILMLLLGAALRHTAGFCWSTNTQLYFQTYYPTADLGLWLSWVSIVGGSIGVTTGGFVSDVLVKRMGLDARIWVLSGSQLLATPFAVGTLFLAPQWCFVSLLTAYLFAEMWFGVVLTIAVELVPEDIKSSAVGVFLFIINNVAGNMPLAVDGLSRRLGYREALYILYPGMYFASSVVFLLTAFAVRRRTQRPYTVQT